MSYEVRLEQRTSRPLAVVRRLASQPQLAQVVPAACGLVWNSVRAAQRTDAGRHVAVYLDGQINLEVGVELEAPFTAAGEVVPSATPAGLVATTTHFGPYGQLALAHEAVQKWCHANGHSLAGPSWEIYGHWQDSWNRDPSQICTEVCYLVTCRSPESKV